MSEPKYLVGIDLGTSNCAMAFAEPAQGKDAEIVDFHVPQLQRIGEVRPRALLPSCLYIPSPHELSPDTVHLPWSDGSQGNLIIGEFARWQGTRVPGRLVASAKSWLCHPRVDRGAAILPWGAPPEVNRISPVAASAALLAYMRRAWDFAHPEQPLASQEVTITVPASFDEVARALTVNAARQAGLERFTLLEEPQAAFYDFTARHDRNLGAVLENIRLVLVVDVGGGTSDFTLVQVGVSPEGPVLRRIAVGEHLMLGGDNMDVTLSHRLEERMLSGDRKLSPAQVSELIQSARIAKEALLDEHGPEQFNVSIVSEGSRLVGRSLTAQITRAEAQEWLLDGFFPNCAPLEMPQRGARVALQELGLPYAQDPAITRHLAAFLRRHAQAGFAALESGPAPSSASPLPRPDAILLNGGVFNSGVIADRLLQVVSGWWPSASPIQLLRHESLELAVARGAAYAGLVRHGMGRRIGGGAAHALYVGLAAAGNETPQALCVIPRGHEEGQTVDLGERVFHLTLGRPVRFPLFSTSSDRVERSGEVIPISEDLDALPPIHTLLKGAGAKTGNVPVHLRAILTEIGTLELWCVSNQSDEQWRLEFELRASSASGSSPPTTIESLPPHFAEAQDWVERVFGRKPAVGAAPGSRPDKRPGGSPPKDVKQLWSSLEKTLGPREDWPLPALRQLWSTLFAGAARRRRSCEHERVFFQMAGYALRPGFGYPLDEWRCEQMFGLSPESVQFHREKIGWAEFWIMWRRIAGGLNEARHQEIWTRIRDHLARRIPIHPVKQIAKPAGIQPEGLDEMVRLAAALEHLSPLDKAELGDWIISRLREPGSSVGGPWAWALGRLGARAPIYGSIHKTVAPGKVTEWVSVLLDPALNRVEGALFAISQLARLTGDRTRDLDDPIRAQVLTALKAAEASPNWYRMVTEVVVLEAADKARALGDTLPVGLTLSPDRVGA